MYYDKADIGFINNKAYHLRGSVVVPDVARYVMDSGKMGKFMMFHADMIENDAKVLNKNGDLYAVLTMNCNKWDDMGFCRGHDITLEEFLDMFCDGVLPPELKP